MSAYVIHGGIPGRERLRILSRVLEPTSGTLLAEVGASLKRSAVSAPSPRCLDWGCGGGDVTVMLARQWPEGFVTGIDLDELTLGLARVEAAASEVGNVEFRAGDVLRPGVGLGGYDLVYARFLLTHLPDPSTATANMVAGLVPGGTLLVEDVDFRGHFCDPASPVFSRYVDLYSELVRSRGCDPNIGPRLPGLLRAAGLEDVRVRVVQPAGFEGEVKLLAAITLEAIADGLIDSGLLSREDLSQMVEELYELADDCITLMSLPRIVQSWGRRSPGTEPSAI